jgi:hypothetical protein
MLTNPSRALNYYKPLYSECPICTARDTYRTISTEYRTFFECCECLTSGSIMKGKPVVSKLWTGFQELFQASLDRYPETAYKCADTLRQLGYLDTQEPFGDVFSIFEPEDFQYLFELVKNVPIDDTYYMTQIPQVVVPIYTAGSIITNFMIIHSDGKTTKLFRGGLGTDDSRGYIGTPQTIRRKDIYIVNTPKQIMEICGRCNMERLTPGDIALRTMMADSSITALNMYDRIILLLTRAHNAPYWVTDGGLDLSTLWILPNHKELPMVDILHKSTQHARPYVTVHNVNKILNNNPFRVSIVNNSISVIHHNSTKPAEVLVEGVLHLRKTTRDRVVLTSFFEGAILRTTVRRDALNWSENRDRIERTLRNSIKFTENCKDYDMVDILLSIQDRTLYLIQLTKKRYKETKEDGTNSYGS